MQMASKEGQTVKAHRSYPQRPVGDAMLGRVINALGEPIDGRGEIVGGIERRVEIQAPGIMGRKPVHEPLQTGIKSIDAMTPIGRGQRQLIIGDRKTGKTTVAIDAIINQRGLGVKCIYVAIGQKGSTVAQTVETLRQHGALSSPSSSLPASDPAPFKYLAPMQAAPSVSTGWRTASTLSSSRRPVEAGRGIPSGVAAAAPPTGPRGVPRRRVLPPQPSAGAGRRSATSAAQVR
jgi:proton translocating ATP synthase F1 alpha subunit